MQGGILAKKFIGARKEQEMSKNSPKKIEEKFPPSARLSIRLSRAANNSLTFLDRVAISRLQSECVTPACTLWDPSREKNIAPKWVQVQAILRRRDGIILRRHTSRGESQPNRGGAAF